MKQALDHYLTFHRPYMMEQIEFYRKNIAFDQIISRAATGATSSGKMNRHQWRVGKDKGKNGAKELIKQQTQLKNSKTFEELFNITDKISEVIYGLGPLWAYDTALRIGFHLDIYPEHVYVQAGVKKGVKKLFNENYRHLRVLAIDEFPLELKDTLCAHEIENFLCIWGKER